jgi:hypothetical protein
MMNDERGSIGEKVLKWMLTEVPADGSPMTVTADQLR